MNIKHLTAIAGIILAALCSACSSKEDELTGAWTTSFGQANDYTKYRVFSTSENTPTYYHTFTFKKGENGDKGEFSDRISPLAFGDSGSNDIKVGSEISGTWKVKDDKIYLYYNDKVSLTHADNIGENDKTQMEETMAQDFLSEYKTVGEKGVPYRIVKRNDKEGLELNLDNTQITLIKREDKE